tara:strand:+ start:57 stop:923 length:867 start_codon:yes stop_codon:yes gene_type:complete
MRSLYFLLILFLVNKFVFSQDHLFSLINYKEESDEISFIFKGTKIINSQSVEMPDIGVLQFTIQHRFGTLNSGFYNLYGLDNSQVRIAFDYGLYDWVSLGLARSSSLKTIDSNIKMKIRTQKKGSKSFPFTIVFNSAVFLKQYTNNDKESDDFLFINQLSYSNQLLIARKINRLLSIQFTPTMLHYNLVVRKKENNDRYAIGIGGRYKLTKRISLNAESFIQLNNQFNNNVLSLGCDIETGGHIFQLHLSNSASMIESYFINYTSGEWFNGDIYFGFNISRVFTLKKR